MLGFQSYQDAAYADELANFHEHGHAGEVWFGAGVMEMVASWTKNLCIDICKGQLSNHHDNSSSEPSAQISSWSVLDVGTGNGLLLQEFAKQGFTDLTGTDYSEGAIDLARGLANRNGFTNINLLVDDALETKLDRKFNLVVDKGTLDAIGLHPDGPIKRIMYWDSISRLVAPGGLLVITSCNCTKDELVQEVDNFNQRRAGEDAPRFRYLDHIRTYPTSAFGGSVGSRVATVAFVKQREETLDDFDMQLIGNFLSFASRGDRVGLNQMLREGISPNVQDYDKRTALHLAASEGHASIVELLVQYKADVNLEDRWQRTPLTDARLYGHRDICRILEVNGGKDCLNGQPMTVRHEEDSNEVNIDFKELNLQHSSVIEQGLFGDSEKVKWRGTWVVKTVIKRHISHPVKMVLSAMDNTLLRELRHPNIVQFLGSILHGEEMILITEHLSRGNLENILAKKVRLDIPTALRFALDIARGMNYLHRHKPYPIVHHHLNPRNLLQDEGGHLKIGEYWVQMLYKRIQPNPDSQRNEDISPFDTKKDIRLFGLIFYQMLEGRYLTTKNIDSNKSVDFEAKFRLSKCSAAIQRLIERCTSKDPSQRPPFSDIIDTLEEVSVFPRKIGCRC